MLSVVEKIQFVQRRGTSCKKWDNQTVMFGEDGLTGLWVADMDFKVAECITEALHKAVDFGVFGYVYPWDGYYNAIMEWEKSHHGYELKKRVVPLCSRCCAGLQLADAHEEQAR